MKHKRNNMKTNTAVITIIVAMIAMIGMTGLAMAGSTTQTYVGDGSYTTSWQGHGGTMNIDTYTSTGEDHLAVDYQNGHTDGYQTASTNGWTEVDREVTTRGRYASIDTSTADNSGDQVDIHASADRGRTSLTQTVYTTDEVFGYDVDGVASIHEVTARGQDAPSVYVYTRAGNAYTVVDLGNDYRRVEIRGVAVAGSGYGCAATGQYFDAEARGTGDAYIVGAGDSVGINAWIRNDNTWYSAYGREDVYIELYDEYDSRYRANGYIYAIDLPSTV